MRIDIFSRARNARRLDSRSHIDGHFVSANVAMDVDKIYMAGESKTGQTGLGAKARKNLRRPPDLVTTYALKIPARACTHVIPSILYDVHRVVLPV